MNTGKEKRRWPLTFVIIAAVVIASAILIYNYRDNLGSIPMSAVSDGSGGAITAWQEEQGIYIQRINASGKPLWKDGGILVSEAGARLDPYGPSQTSFTLIPDGIGGAIITWDDKSVRPKDRDDPAYFDPIPFYSQRISPDGEFLWKGAIIASGDAGLYGGEFPIVIADGTGGAVFAWNSYKTYFRGLHDDFLRLQKLTPEGTRLWGNEGRLMVTSSPYRPLTEEEKDAGIKGTVSRSRPTYAGTHDIVSDGARGCIVIWEEEGEQSSYKVFVQRLDSRGDPAWMQVLAGGGRYQYNSLQSDGSGGAVLALSLRDTGTAFQHHIGSSGELLEMKAYSSGAISDGFGGSIQVRVEDEPAYGPPNERSNILYVQRFDAERRPLWPEKQVLATPERYQIGELEYIADGTGGIILFWRVQKESVSHGGLFAQRLDAEGNLKWGEEGVAVFGKPDKYQGNVTLLSDGSGGTLVIAIAGKNAFGGDMVYAWPLARITIVGAETASSVIFAKEIKESADPRETAARKIAEYREKYENPYKGAERGYIDDVIDPADTRRQINRALDLLANKTVARPWRKYSNINL